MRTRWCASGDLGYEIHELLWGSGVMTLVVGMDVVWSLETTAPWISRRCFAKFLMSQLDD